VQIFDNPADLSGPEVRVRAEAGTLDEHLFEGVFNAPLSSAFAARAAFRLRSRDGGVENALTGEPLNDQQTGAVRLATHWRASPAITSDLFLDYERDRDHGRARQSHTFEPTDPISGAVLGSLASTSLASLAAGPGFDGGRGLGLDR